MKKFLFLLLLIPSVAYSAYDYKLTRVLDGDTVEFIMPGLPVELGDKLKLRVLGVDTPEKGGRAACAAEAKAGDAATAFAKKVLAEALVVQFEIKEWDKFGGRVLGDVIYDGKRLSEELIKAGLARPYFGDKKKSWCE
jgi:endonuclease YncB( thermonuclease family)